MQDITGQALTEARTTAQPAWWAWIVARRWPLALALVIVIGAAGVRLLTYERYLPYADYGDETTYAYIWPRMLLGYTDFDHMRTRYGPPPPMYNAVAAGVHLFVDAQKGHDWTLPAQYYHALRVLAMGTGVITTGTIIGLGWLLAGPLAGLLAGLVWGFAPVIVDHNSLAIPDPLVYLFTALALFTALRAWQKQSPVWLLASLLAGIAAIYNKYWIWPTVVPFMIVLAILLYRQPRRMLPWLLVYVPISAASAAYLLLVVNPLGAVTGSREINEFRESGLAFATNPSRLYNNFWHAVYPVGLALFLLPLATGVAGYIYNRRTDGRTLNLPPIALLLIFAAATIVMSAAFSNVWLDAGKIRHVLPVTVALLPVWGAALAQTGWALGHAFRQTRWRGLATYGPALIVVPLLVVYLPGNADLIRQYNQMYVVEAIWRWTDSNLPADGRVLNLEYSGIGYIWNRPYTGYDGDRPFEWWTETRDEIVAQTPAQYANERGIAYFVISDEDIRQRSFNNAAARAFLDQLTRVKTFNQPAGTFGGPVTHFYRMLPQQHTADADFGGQVRLVGYDLETGTAQPGGAITFRPYWRIATPPDDNYSMFLHLYPADEITLLAQADGAPTTPERPTLIWDDPDELYLGWDHAIALPPDLSPGDYRLAVGLYNPANGLRLRLPDDTEFFSIPVTISAD